MELKMGLYDAPQKQSQPIFTINLLKKNVAVYGAVMSGKTTFIKTLLVRLHEEYDHTQEHIYIIDFGGALSEFGQCGNVCACFDSRNEENIKRIFKTIERQISDNEDKLNGMSYYEAYKRNKSACPPHITLIVENLNAFLGDERYSTYQDVLLKFCRDGLTKGLTVVFTANDISGTSRFLSSFGQKVAFNMPADSYFEIFSNKVIRPMNISGRCIVNIENDNYECQCFLPFAPKSDDALVDDEKELEILIQKTNSKPNPYKLVAFPEELTFENVAHYSSVPISLDAGDILVGLDYYEHRPAIFNYIENRAIGIYGKSMDEMMELLKHIIQQVKTQVLSCRFVFVDDHRNRLEENFGDIIKDKSNILAKDVDFIVKFATQENYIGENSVPYVGVENKPFTVFVIQHKMLYTNPHSCLSYDIPELISSAERDNTMFIFSDIKKIADSSAYIPFNSSLSIAFLLDNIGDFVNDKGSRSVFGEMDARELRAKYARCERGDGYFYAAQKDDEVQKIKFIK